MQDKSEILLHACCATCCAYPLSFLIDSGYTPVVFYSNSNIYPAEEYRKRLVELVSYSEKKKFKLIIDDYSPDNWHNYIKGFENEPEKGIRCVKCFDYRLSIAALKAFELGIDKFTTTLTVSPHKRSSDVFASGKRAGIKYSVKFMDFDFKKNNGFLKSMQIAKEENFYRQNYCGCEYSIR